MAESRDQSKTPSRTKRIAGSTLIVMIGWGASIVVGLVRQRIIAGQFGTSAVLDAFTAANVIPELIFTMLSGGALSFAFIPIYTELMTKGDPQRPNRLFSQVVNLIFLITFSTAILAALTAPWLVSSRWGVGANFTPEVQQMTVQLMRILLLSTLLFAVSSIFTATLYAHQHFIIPALLPSMYSLGIIIGTLVLSPRFGIFGVAWGAVLGAGMHLLIQIPGLIHYKVKWQPNLRLEPAVRRVAILMAPRIIDLLMARASINWLNATLSSRLGPGNLAALDYAYRLMNMPWTLIGTAIGIAVFPTLAALAAEKDLEAQKRAMSGAMRAILTLAIPAAAGLIVLGTPVIRLLFEGGEFTAESTQMVYFALKYYTLALITQSVLEVVVRSFASQQDTYTPLYISFFTTGLNIALAIWLTKPIEQGGLSLAGPALANGIAVGVEALTGLTILSIRWKGIHARQILLDAGKALLAAVLMSGVIWGVENLLGFSGLYLLVIGGGLGAAVYFVTAYFLGIKEVLTIPLSLLKRQQPAQ
jgi:putative peptidoglycan lipid II flippase